MLGIGDVDLEAAKLRFQAIENQGGINPFALKSFAADPMEPGLGDGGPVRPVGRGTNEDLAVKMAVERSRPADLDGPAPFAEAAGLDV